MKHIIINEQQEKLLIKEFMQYGFSLATMNKMDDFKERIKYCKKYLGEPLGHGVSRIAFEIGDDEVLKLALTNEPDDIRQNKMEWFNYTNATDEEIQSLLPRVYQHADDFSWLIVERVLPLKYGDYEKILGIPYDGTKWQTARKNVLKMKGFEKERQAEEDFDKTFNMYQFDGEPRNGDIFTEDDYSGVDIVSFMDFIRWMIIISSQWASEVNSEKSNFYYNLINTDPWFHAMYKYINNCHGNDIHHTNLGLTIRNNKPWIVILDSGFDVMKF